MKSRFRGTIALLVLVAGMMMLLLGSRAKYRVYEPQIDEFGLQPFRKISGAQVVIDATFGGIALKEGKLISTYDRSIPVGKRACPT